MAKNVEDQRQSSLIRLRLIEQLIVDCFDSFDDNPAPGKVIKPEIPDEALWDLELGALDKVRIIANDDVDNANDSDHYLAIDALTTVLSKRIRSLTWRITCSRRLIESKHALQ